MPFDGVTLQQDQVQTRPKGANDDLTFCSIEVIVAALGIEPISKTMLNQHKQTEIDRHPPSLFLRFPLLAPLLLTVMLAAVVAIAAIVTTAHTQNHVMQIAACVGLAGILGWMIKLVAFTKVKERAFWKNECIRFRHLEQNAGIPAPLMQMAKQIYQVAPHAIFTVGTLYQNTVVLDPYLLVTNCGYPSDTHVCLGIWDDDRIIRIAKTN